MIICQICKKEFKNFRCLSSHTTQSHKISKEEYYKNHILLSPNFISQCKNCGNPTKFINSSKGYQRCCGIKCGKLFDCKNPEYIKNISIKTKEAMKNPDVRERFLTSVRKPKSKETLKKMSISGKEKFINDPTIKDRIYTKERNEKISKAKKLYWKTHPKEKIRVGNIWKLLKNKDENKWRKHLLKASKLGFEKIFGENGETTLEIKMYKFLEDNNIKFEKQYEIEYKLYDAFLPDYHILLEFDGEFWHKKTLNECQYDFQITSYHNDILKNEIAKEHNIPLFRIREDDPPERILEYINSIKSK
jgi:hypothetical protein